MSLAVVPKKPEHQVGRYAIFDEIAAGGMATVHLARLAGSGGFSRVVAAKRMHRHFLQDANFRNMFLAEARLAARVQHPNVVPILDVLSDDRDELIIVMEYVHGESLLALLRTANKAKQAISVPIACAIAAALCEGLHAAHEAQNEKGEPLGIVHRDVSPQNVLVGADGVARVLDFGIAKAVHEQTHTNPGTLKGKFSYMAPEVVHGAAVTRQADVFSAGIVLWEALAGKMLFGGASEHERLMRIANGNYPSPRQHNPRVSLALEAVVAKALDVDTRDRYATALEFAEAIEHVVPIASRRVVGAWVRRLAETTLDEREAMIHAIETSSIVALSELPAANPNVTGTPPPLPSVPSQGPQEDPRTLADEDSYATLEIQPASAPKAENPPAARRRPSARVLAVAAAVALATLILVFALSRPAKVPSTVPGVAAPQGLPSAQVSGATPAAPAPVPPVVQPTPASNEAPPTAQSEKAEKAEKAPPKRALPSSPSSSSASSSARTRGASHAKHYLPSNL
jgi:serine/threonine protein kinase